MLRGLTLAAVITVVLPLAAIVAPAGADAATAGCTGSTVAIQQFSFSPSSVQVGQDANLSLVLQNCTSQTVQGSVTVLPEYTWAGQGIPPGCPFLDPVGFSFTMAPGGTYTNGLGGMGDPFPSCQATGIHATASVAGTTVTATADLVIEQPTSPPPTSPPPTSPPPTSPPPTSPPPGGSCHVTYTPSDWQGGFTANVTISNSGSTAINGWTVTFAFPGDQKVTNAWNATITQNGTNVTAKNVSYNASIPAGGSQSFGFQGTWTSSDASPTSFSVNGVACR
jgi:cellulase/cellobiase CelA1